MINIDDDLAPIESEKFHYDYITVEFTRHFKKRMVERVEHNILCNFLNNIREFIEKVAEKVFLSVTREYRVYCKLIRSYVIIHFNAIQKHIRFITTFPLERDKLETKYTDTKQLLITA